MINFSLKFPNFLKITLQSPETGTVDFAPRKFSIRETQGDRDVCKNR